MLAARPDAQFSTTKLAEATGLTRGELSGGFSGFTRVCRSLRKDVDLDWPIQWTFGVSEKPGQQDETHYWLPAAVAERWLQSDDR